MQGNEQRFERILANVDRLSADLSDISTTNKQDVRATIANLRAFSDTLKSETPGLVRKLEEMSERVSNIAGDNRENLKESIANLKTASARLDNTLDAAGKVMAKIERGEDYSASSSTTTRPTTPSPKPSTGSTGTSGSTMRCG